MHNGRRVEWRKRDVITVVFLDDDAIIPTKATRIRKTYGTALLAVGGNTG